MRFAATGGDRTTRHARKRNRRSGAYPGSKREKCAARGGAALSLREVTQRPSKFVGTGEKLDQFEPVVPERLAGRILGMGDVVGLVEKAAETIEIEDAERLERKLRSASFDFNDFLAQFKMLRKMGPLENVLGMLPGMGNVPGVSIDEKQL